MQFERESANTEQDEIHNLFEAIEVEDVERVRSILTSNKVNINQWPNSREMTVLHLAVGINSSEIVQLLLQHNADPNSRNCNEHVSPLHLSILYGCVDIFKMLMKAGGNPHLEDADRKTCFDLAKENELTCLFEDLTIDKSNDNKSVVTSDINKWLDTVSSNSGSGVSSSNHLRLNLATAGKEESSSNTFTITEVPAEVKQVLNNSLESLSSDGINNLNRFTFTTEEESTSTLLTPSSSLNSSRVSNSDGEQTCGEVSSSGCSSSTTGSVFIPSHCIPPTEEELLSIRSAAAALGLPVLPSTLTVLSKFVDPQTQTITLSPQKATSTHGYSMELDLGLREMNIINHWREHQVEFIQTSKSCKNTGKSFFNYLLLDPYVIKPTNFFGNNLKTRRFSNPEKFDNFLKAVFYIGKGSGTRPLQHMVEAKQRFVTKQKHRLQDNTKLDKVLSIWERGQGVMVLSLFQNSPELEANANEAAMIDSIGLSCVHLTNVRKGSYVNSPAVNWSQKKKNQFGAFLLYKAYCMFVVSECKIFYPNDI